MDYPYIIHVSEPSHDDLWNVYVESTESTADVAAIRMVNYCTKSRLYMTVEPQNHI